MLEKRQKECARTEEESIRGNSVFSWVVQKIWLEWGGGGGLKLVLGIL